MDNHRITFNLRTIWDLAHHLQVDQNFINDLLTQLESNEKKLYRSWDEPKKSGSGGTRPIDAPRLKLKILQNLINKKILQRTKVHDAAFGGIKGKKLTDFLRVHCGKHTVMIFDLKDFFPNIKQTQVHRMFCDLGIVPKVAKILTCLTTFKGRLPQGAPTSQMIANIIAGSGKCCLDKRVEGLCKKNESDQGRWVDDIPISGPAYLPDLKRTIEKIITQSGFTPKPEKTKIYTKNEAQVVTGHLVNIKPNIMKVKRKMIRAELHRYKINKNITERQKAILRGRIAHSQNVNSELGEKLLTEFNSL